jgi:hypothetical protein
MGVKFGSETRICNFAIRVSHFESVRSLGDYAVCVALGAEAVRGVVRKQSTSASRRVQPVSTGMVACLDSIAA